MTMLFRVGRLKFRKWLLSSLLIGGVLINQVGCGTEGITVPMIVTGLGVTTAVVVAVHEVAEWERASLDMQLKRIELQGLSNGQQLTTFRYLTDEEVRKCASSGKIIVNGVSTPVTMTR